MFNPPFGYERYLDKELGKNIRPDGVKSIIVKEVLEMFASNQLETIADVQKHLALKLSSKKIMIHTEISKLKEFFYNLLYMQV